MTDRRQRRSHVRGVPALFLGAILALMNCGRDTRSLTGPEPVQSNGAVASVQGPQSTLAFVITPSSGVAGEPLTPAPSVQFLSPQGKPQPRIENVGASLEDGTSLQGTTTVVSVDGVARFTNLVVPTPGTYVIVFSAGGAQPVRTSLTIIPPTRLLDVTLLGGGSGTVRSTPAGIDCGATCSAPFPTGSLVTLTAIPAPLSAFVGFGGAGCSGAEPCVVTMDAAKSVTATFERVRFPITVTRAGTGGGTVTSAAVGIDCGLACSAEVDAGTAVTLTASPDAMSTFDGWSGACSGTGTCVVTVDAAKSVTAVFTRITFPLTVTRAGTGGGRVQSTPAGIDCGASCTAAFDPNTSVLLTATPDPTSTFTGWTGACERVVECRVTMDAAKSVTATFQRIQYVLSVSTSGSGHVTSTPTGISCPGGSCGTLFDAGSHVTLNPVPDVGFVLKSWGGECTGNAACTVTMDGPRSVSAIFALPPGTVTVTVNAEGSATGTITSTPAGIACPGVCSAPFFGSVTLTAAPGPNSLFTGWSEAACGKSTTCTVSVFTGTTVPVTASFVPARYPLHVDLAGPGAASGRVVSSPAGIDCGSTCDAMFVRLSSVRLDASATAPGVAFAGWSGACGGSGACSVPMNAAQSVTATFVDNGVPVALTIESIEGGAGRVFSSPEGIDCTTSCTGAFVPNALVTLVAVAATGSEFAGWSGACSGTNLCSFVASAPNSVTAVFRAVPPRRLSVVRAGSGAGSVTSAPAGISCGTTCDALFPDRSWVTLTATVGPNSRFDGWSGACTGTGTCSVQLTSDLTVTATFTTTAYPLTVTKAGTGTGTVSSTPSGIACGSTCSASFAVGALVTLTPVTGAGSVFDGWSGACSGTGSCVVTMDAAKSVTATFTLPVWPLAVTRTGPGRVTSSPTGIDCGSTCSAEFFNNTSVSLTATPDQGASFAGWSGSVCSGTALRCTVMMTAARSVNATFVGGIQLSVTRVGSGTGTVTSTPAGIDCGATCVAGFSLGTQVTLTATAGPSSVFAGWSGGGCAGTGTCMVTMSTATTVTATFNTTTTAMVTVNKVAAVGGAPITGGLVTSQPSGIDCGATCAAVLPGGTVQLFASSNAGGMFVQWGPGPCLGSTSATCTFLHTSAVSVTAVFNAPSYGLTVERTGSGDGTVATVGSGAIQCPTLCFGSFSFGTLVTLRATPNAVSEFTGWSGGGCSGTGDCTVTMDAAKKVTATFTVNSRSLTVTTSGTGAGVVSSSPAGILCPATCAAIYPDMTVVRLTASPDTTSTFGGWSGACSGTDPCDVTIDAAKLVGAVFTRNTFTLSITIVGSGGAVSTDGQYRCYSGTCAFPVPQGNTVTLVSDRPAGTFTGWSGADCSGTGSCVVTMNASKSVTATFSP